ncbi:thiamine phosphate synthase [Alphaproteobacteria bacterium]|nr:thiamine phosphate synthase [Alphaproteobacteria bacterium]
MTAEALDDYETGLLYLIIEDQGQTDFAFLAPLIKEQSLASVLLTQATEATAVLALKTCRDLDVPLLIEDDVDLAKKIGADGVHLVNPKALTFARNTLAEDAVVGVSCGPTRHEAMELGEQEPDYILFGGYAADQDPAPVDQDLVAWWLEMMEIPIVAVARTDDETKQLRLIDCDFIGRFAS